MMAQKKPFYFAVMAIFKNETLNLRLWLDHHIWQGAQHFFLIDNGSTDRPLCVLQDYIDRGIVTYRSRPEPYLQVHHYRSLYADEDIPSKTRWLAVLDLDEFVFGVSAPLRSVLVGFEDTADIIQMNWLMFGTHLEKHPPDVRTALTMRAPNMHGNTKVLFQTDVISNPRYIHMHRVLDDFQFRKRVENEHIHLHHYPLQSMEYFTTVKMTRGDAYHKRYDTTRNLSYFESINRDSTVVHDDTLARLVRDGYALS